MAKEEPMFYVQCLDDKFTDKSDYAFWFNGKASLNKELDDAIEFNKTDALELCREYEAVAFPCHVIDQLLVKPLIVLGLRMVYSKDLHKPKTT